MGSKYLEILYKAQYIFLAQGLTRTVDRDLESSPSFDYVSAV